METFKQFTSLNEASEIVTKTYTIAASPNVIEEFEKFMKYVQWCASVGHSTYVAMSIDGDGPDRFKVTEPSLEDVHYKVHNMQGGVERV